MAVIENLTGAATLQVESDRSALRAVIVPRGVGFGVSEVTGLVAAALAANASVFAMRIDPGAPVRLFLDHLRLQFTTITAFTTPITLGRRLALFRGSGAAASGGTAIAAAVRRHTAFGATSECDAANGGDIRIATTGALTVAGITFEANPLAVMTLTHVGTAGAFADVAFEFGNQSCEVVLEPGQLLAVRNPIALDAAGTWQLSVNAQWREAVAF